MLVQDVADRGVDGHGARHMGAVFERCRERKRYDVVARAGDDPLRHVGQEEAAREQVARGAVDAAARRAKLAAGIADERCAGDCANEQEVVRALAGEQIRGLQARHRERSLTVRHAERRQRCTVAVQRGVLTHHGPANRIDGEAAGDVVAVVEDRADIKFGGVNARRQQRQRKTNGGASG